MRFRTAAVLIILISVLLSGCGQADDEVTLEIKEKVNTFDMTPCKKDSGEPFVIAVLDEVPPFEGSWLWLKGMAEQFQDMGYIPQTVDLSLAPDDYEGYFDYLRKSDLGEYIRFDDTCYMIDSTGREELAQTLRKRAKQGKIDVIASTGTTPGLFLKEIDPDVPYLVSMATDPVASGIIPSADDTGDKDVWALVEVQPFFRQLQIYENIFGFQKLGILTIDEYQDIAGVGEYENSAQELGIEVIKETVPESLIGKKRYDEFITKKVRKMIYRGMDAFLVPYGLLEEEQAPMLLELLQKNDIPYLISDGSELVRGGGLMCISCYDYEGYGRYAAMLMSDLFHGVDLGDHPTEYHSSPRIIVNTATAKKLHYDLTYQFMQSADSVFSSDTGKP